MKKQSKCYIMVGLPASGKSTVRDDIINVYKERGDKIVVVSPDEIRGELCGELCGDVSDQSRNAEVWSLAHTRLHENLKKGYSVIFDATSVDRKSRKQLIKIADRSKAGKVAVWMDTPIRVCKERNRKRERVVPEFVYDRMSKKYTKPKIDEGFNSIIKVDKKVNIKTFI